MAIEPRRGGAKWVKSLTGGTVGTPPIIRKVVASNNTLAVFTGDWVQIQTDGTVYPCTTGGGAYATLSGVVVGIERYLGPDSIMRRGTYLPAATTYTGTVSLSNPLASVIYMIPWENQIFELDIPTAAATYTAATALIGQCADIVATAGSTVTGQSGHTSVAVGSFEATTVSGQMLLKAIPQYGLNGLKNDPTTTYWKGHFVAYETLSAV